MGCLRSPPVATSVPYERASRSATPTRENPSRVPGGLPARRPSERRDLRGLCCTTVYPLRQRASHAGRFFSESASLRRAVAGQRRVIDIERTVAPPRDTEQPGPRRHDRWPCVVSLRLDDERERTRPTPAVEPRCRRAAVDEPRRSSIAAAGVLVARERRPREVRHTRSLAVRMAACAGPRVAVRAKREAELAMLVTSR